MQAATILVASVIHSHYIGLDITKKITIPHSAQLPSKAAAKEPALDSSDQLNDSHAATECALEAGISIQNAEAASACSQQECPSADTSHHPGLYDSALSQHVEHEHQVRDETESGFSMAPSPLPCNVAWT